MGWEEGGEKFKKCKRTCPGYTTNYKRLGWKSNPGNDSCIRSHQYFNPYARYNETMEDVHKATLVNDIMKVQIKCFEIMRYGHCLLKAFILRAKSK